MQAPNFEYVFSLVSTSCAAIYYGGSRVDPVIDNPHDYDYICFSKHWQSSRLNHQLSKYKFKAAKSTMRKQTKEVTTLNDFSQIRQYPYTHITWFSYLDPLMIKAIGEDVCPKTDVIYEHRAEFLACLQDRASQLISGKMMNQKRWYHILRGIYILSNNSYEVTPEQRLEINILHDLAPGYEQVRDKTIELLKTLK